MAAADFETHATDKIVGRDLPPSGLPRIDALPLNEELMLGRRIEAGLFAARLLMPEFAEHPLRREAEHSPGLEQDLKTIIDEGKEAFERLVLANTGLAVLIARRFWNGEVEQAELVNGAMVGLLYGLEKYDYTRGIALRAYAAHWIRKEVGLVAAGSKTRPYIQKDRRIGAALLRRTARELAERLKREPTNQELATATGIEPDEVGRLRDATAGAASLDEPYIDGGAETRGELLVDDSAVSPEHQAVRADSLRRVREAISSLADLMPKRASTSEITRLYYGIGGRSRSVAEIAQTFHMGVSSVYKIIAHAKGQLRAHLTSDLFD